MRLLFTFSKIILLVGIIISHNSLLSQGGTTCANMQPICTDVGANFTAGTGSSSQSGPNYGCLSTQPNPSWYYFEIGTSGAINMNLYANSDIDYAIWGPFSSFANAQGNCGAGLGAPIDCSYSSTNDEYPSIAGAVVGQVYVMLITNYASVVQDITLVQTSGSGATNCNIVYPCNISNFTANIGPCVSPANTYSITGAITYQYPPSSGNLVVQDCNGTQTVVASAPFPTSTVLNYTVNNMAANGAPCSLTAFFTAEACPNGPINFTAPNPCNPGCAITSVTAAPGNCLAGNTYNLTGQVAFTSPPTSGTLTVSNSCGGSQVFNYPFPASPVAYSLAGLTANGAACTVTASFSATPCTLSGNYTAPALPNANAGTAQIINCTNLTRVLTGSSSSGAATYSWSGPGIVSGGSSATPTVNAAGSYTVTVTNSANNCTSTANVSVTSNTTPPNANAGTAQVLTCTTSSAVLSGSSSTLGATFSWSGPGIVSGGTTATPTVNAVGTYTLTVTNPTNGCTATSTVNVTQTVVPPNANAGTTQVLSCTTTSVVLGGSSSTGGVTFSWAGPGIVSGGSTATPTVNQAGMYTLTVTNPLNGCTATATVNVTQNITPPNANAGTAQVLTCTTTSAILSGSSSTIGATFSWSGPGIVSGGTTATPTVNQAGTYTLTVTNPTNGCTATATVNVTQNITPPNANAGVAQILSCSVTSISLSGSSSTGGATFSWSGPGIVSGGTTATPSVNQAGTYVLTVTNPTNGCTATSNATVTNDVGIPNANAGAAQILNCNVTSIALGGSSSTAGVTFSWTGPGIVSGGTTATPTVNQIGSYTLTVSDPSNGCSATSNANVTQNITPPNANAGAAQILNCTTTSVVLSGSSSTGGVTFSWAGPGIVSGGTTATPTVNQPGTYTQTVTNPANGCTATATVNITQDITTPNANAGTTQVLNCTTTSVVLNGSSSTGGVTFSWAGPGIVSGGSSATPTVNQSGTYTQTVTNPVNGCTTTATVNITQNITPPNANAGASQVLSCTVTSISLNGSSSTGGATFSWSGPGIVSGGTTATPSVNQAGTYILTVTDPVNGCTSTSNTTVTNDLSVPNANAGPTNVLNCNVTSLVLGGSSSTVGVTYSWSGPGIVSGGTTSTPTIDQPGSYVLTVMNPINGCSNTSNVDITQNVTIPNANAGTTQELNCINNSTITANGSSSTSGVTYSWAGPGISSGGNTATPVLNQPGMYTLTVTDPVNGCTNTSTVNITEDIALPLNDFVADSLYGCGSVPVNFQETSGQIGMNYGWNFGNGNTSTAGSSVSEFFDQVGCYTVSLTVTDPTNGCSVTEILPTLICVIPEPNAEFSTYPSQLESIDGLVTLTNGSTNATEYQWNFGDGTPGSIAMDPTHDYSDNIGNYTIQLVASNQGLCFDTTYVQIEVIESLIFYVPNAFTPDGDSYNEYFKPVFYSGFDPYDFTMLIFNRWGEIVWESHNYNVGWNGTFNGSTVLDGVYTWKIEVKTNRTDERKSYVGHVSIIR